MDNLNDLKQVILLYLGRYKEDYELQLSEKVTTDFKLMDIVGTTLRFSVTVMKNEKTKSHTFSYTWNSRQLVAEMIDLWLYDRNGVKNFKDLSK